MKKHSLAVVALLFLFANTIYAQKINCAWCKNGDGYNLRRDWIVCLNCKNWAKSYRDKVPCTVCKDNRGHYSAYYKVTCSDCKGSGRNYAAEKKAKWDSSEEGIKYNKENDPVLAYRKRLEELSNKPVEEKKIPYCEAGYFDDFIEPSTDQIKSDLLGRKLGTWTFDKIEEFKRIYQSASIDKYNCTLEVKVDVVLEDYSTHKRFDGYFVLKYWANDVTKKWICSGIIPGVGYIRPVE